MLEYALEDIDMEIRGAAEKHELPERILRAVIQVESSGDPWVMRYEAHVRPYEPMNYTNYNNTYETEVQSQKFSWGLMQVLGSTARWLGLDEVSVGVLIDVEVSLEYGCRYLKYQYGRYGNWKDACAAYNAGSVSMTNGQYSNQQYVNRIDDQLGGRWPGE